jgi:hypothetical protein
MAATRFLGLTDANAITEPRPASIAERLLVEFRIGFMDSSGL